jgi:transcriptional regulator
MHPNPAYRPDDQTAALAIAREAGFGMLAVSVSDAAPMLSHIPFLLSDDGTQAELHLVRSNPIARDLSTPAPARLAVQGPHGYISPDWYGLDDQVPTWNYLAIHLTGRLEAMPDAHLPDLLARQSAYFEAGLAPKPEWRMDKLDPETAARLMRQIRPFRLNITQVDSTWKLGQNKPEAARLSAADHLQAQGRGAETRLLAALMRRPPE